MAAFAPAAVLAGAVGALGPALFLASAPPGLLAAALRGVAGWGVSAGPVLAVALAWRAAADRELGLAQLRFTAGEAYRVQVRGRAQTLLVGAGLVVPAAAVGGVLAAAADQAEVGRWDLTGGPTPGLAFVGLALAAPAAGLLVGALAGLAAATRRQLITALVAAVVVTVTVLLVRPYSDLATTLTPTAPLGSIWPLTLGWSLSRWFAVDLSITRRLAGALPWLALLALAAWRSWRQGPCRRAAATADRR